MVKFKSRIVDLTVILIGTLTGLMYDSKTLDYCFVGFLSGATLVAFIRGLVYVLEECE